MADGRQHVVFLNIPGTGHMNPTLPVVAELRARGVEVTYFVPEMMREVVEAAGATWRSMQDPEKFTEEQLARYFPEGTPKADKEFPVSVIPMAATSLPGFISDLTALQPPPTAIVYDPFLPQGLVAAKHLGIPCIGSVTITGPGAIQLPPFLIKEWESKEPICRGRREIQDRYQFDIFEHGILMQFYSPDQNFVSTIDSLYLPPSSPVQLDRFGHFPFHCVGPLLNPEVKRVTHAKAGVIAGESKRSFPWEEVDAALAASKKVVLISLGTVANSAFWSKPFGPHAAKNGLHETTGKEFVQFVIGRAFEALGQEEDLLAVLVTGPQQDALEGLPAPPKNFILQETVPQLELLPKCHAFVTHGGANSMHESLRFGIPMAVVPMFGDQPGNADAVAERGAGFSFRNPLDSLTASAFRSAVTQLLAPEDANPFLATVQSMSKEMLQAGGVQLACELILETAANRPSKLGGA